MESNARPLLYYLIKNRLMKNRKGVCIIVAATDVQMQELYNEGVRWHGVPFNTRAEAEAALASLKSNLTQ
jgi:hypothetical protein